MSWIELKLSVPPRIVDEISGYLFAMGCEGIQVAEDEIIVYFSAHRWTSETQLAITAYMQQIFPSFMKSNLSVKNVADRDWNQTWREGFKHFALTSRITVAPPWEEYHARAGELVVIINPQMAFGTGHHESTQLAAQALQKWLAPGNSVLDVGAGSGILAFAAKKLGADFVTAIDSDVVAIKNAEENYALNSSPDNMIFLIAKLEDIRPREYDLVVANINRNILLNYASLFPLFLTESGLLILAGILNGDEKDMIHHFSGQGFKLHDKNFKREWLSLVFRKGAK